MQQPSGIAGDGETRTRTGDTTIFSRAAGASETGLFAGNSVDSGHVYGVRAFPDFAPVSPALRQMAGIGCLFIGGDGDPDRPGGAAPHVGCPGARLRGRGSHSVIADRGYDPSCRRGVTPVIARRCTDHGSGLARVRWVV